MTILELFDCFEKKNVTKKINFIFSLGWWTISFLCTFKGNRDENAHRYAVRGEKIEKGSEREIEKKKEI